MIKERQNLVAQLCVLFRCLIRGFRPESFIIGVEIASLKKTSLLQREPFLKVFYIALHCSLLSGFFILSNYQKRQVPLN